MKTLCVLTIGQSPREDMHETFKKYIPHVNIVERGILDSYKPDEIETLVSSQPGQTLVSRLRDGTKVRLEKKFVDQELGKLVAACQDDHIDAILVACTGKFELFTSTKPILYPDYIVSQIVKGLFREKEIGVVVPLSEQRTEILDKWNEAEIDCMLDSCTPYQVEWTEFQKVAERMDEWPIQAIILDCMGYDDKMKQYMSRYTEKPILPSRNLVFAAVAEMF
ncbi:AroM family protein [Mammaliicoccus sciuri]|uniref:Protein AroM n=1 Tax=Sporosarcina newyorkensis TaxID=759851 RepID=A0A1T4YAB8_9BACL|nr:AroM family protein [Sporosarcina newyorkensis]SKA98706.1 protein AroM [Sporosarcina newyorkensis]